MKTSENIFDKLVNITNRIYCMLVFAVIPLIYIEAFIDGYSWGKIIIGLIATLVVLMLNTIKRIVSFYSGQNHEKLKSGLVEIITWVLIVFTSTSLFLAEDLEVGFYGIHFGPEGYISIMLNIAIMVVFYEFISIKHIHFIDILVGACMVSAIALLEDMYIIEPICYQVSYRFVYGVNISTIGNAGVIGTYVSMVFPIAVMFFMKKNKILGVVFLAFIGVLTYIISTTSSLLTMFITVIVFPLFLGDLELRKKYIRFLAVLGVGSMIGALIILVKDKSIITRIISSILNDFRKLQETHLGYDRLSLWRKTLQHLGDRPVFGYGPDSFGIMHRKFYGPVINVYHKVYNVWLQRAITLGIPAMLAYSALEFIPFVKKGNGDFPSEIERDIIVAFKVSIFAYLVHGIFNINQSGVSFIFHAFLGFVLSLMIKKANHIGKI